MLDKLTDGSRTAMEIGMGEAQRLRHLYLGAEHVFIGLCKIDDVALASAFQQAKFNPVHWRRLVRSTVAIAGSPTDSGQMQVTPRLANIIAIAHRIACKQGADQILPHQLLLAILAEGRSIPVRLLRKSGYDLERLAEAVLSQKPVVRGPSQSKFPVLNSLGRDLIHAAREGRLPRVVGRHREIREMAQQLRRKTKGNILIIGEAGTGKSSLVYGFAQLIASSEAHPSIKDLILFEIQMSDLIASTKYRGEFEARMQQLLAEAGSDPNVVLFFDEFHLLKGAGAAGSAMDVANLLKPALASGQIHCIGATTRDEYRRYIETDKALDRRFMILEIAPPSAEETRQILIGLKAAYEQDYQVTITEDGIEAAVELADRYIHQRNFPDKAIDLLEGACATALVPSVRKNAVALAQAVVDRAAVVAVFKRTCKVDIPDDFLAPDQRKLLISLADRIKKQVVGQDHAVEAVVRTIQSHSAGMTNSDRPIGAFLFVGPSGVGKTELARAVAQEFFGTLDNKLLRFDMSEYSEPHTVTKLLGAPPSFVGYDDEGLLSRMVRSNPYSVVLFDEMEKAHPDILKIFLQILEPGRITDNRGQVIDFNHAIVIFTSNLGSAMERPMGVRDNLNLHGKIMHEVKRTLAPEFINRLDEVVIFDPITEPSARRHIVEKALSEVRGLLAAQGIRLEATPEALDLIMEQGYSLEYGAREIRRTINRLVQQPISLQILSGAVQRGDTLLLTVADGSLLFDRR